MKLRSLAAGACFGVMAQVQASRGLMVARVYISNAVEIKTAISNHCSTQFPDLVARSSQAYEKWLQTNKSRLATLKKFCSKNLILPSEGDEGTTPLDIKNRLGINIKINEENRKIVIDDIIKDFKADREPAARCKEYYAEMEQGKPEEIFDDAIRQSKSDRRLNVGD